MLHITEKMVESPYPPAPEYLCTKFTSFPDFCKINTQSRWGLLVILQKLCGVPRAQSFTQDAPMGQVSFLVPWAISLPAHRPSRCSPAALSF